MPSLSPCYAAITPSGILGGFSVRFDFLGAGTPGSQAFDIVQPEPFTVVESGVTRPRRVAVPEPGTLALLLIGALLLAAREVRLSPRWARFRHSRPSR